MHIDYVEYMLPLQVSNILDTLMYNVHAFVLYYVYCMCIQFVLYMYSICIVYVFNLYCMCIQFVLYVYLVLLSACLGLNSAGKLPFLYLSMCHMIFSDSVLMVYILIY